MARTQRYTAEQVVQAIQATKGMVSLAARMPGCDDQTVRNYAARYASVRDELDMQQGLVLDTAELKLIDAIDRGEPWAIKYRLSTKGKQRGYTTRQEITGQDGGPFRYEVEYVNDWRGDGR